MQSQLSPDSHKIFPSQQIFNCSKSAIEKLEKGVKYVQSQQWRYQNDVIYVFHTYISVSIVEFEQVNICWDCQKDKVKSFLIPVAIAMANVTKISQRLNPFHVTGLFLQPLYLHWRLGHRPATLLKKRLWHRCFPMSLAKFLRTPFYRTSPGSEASEASNQISAGDGC